jgi:hypothetical protein
MSVVVGVCLNLEKGPEYLRLTTWELDMDCLLLKSVLEISASYLMFAFFFFFFFFFSLLNAAFIEADEA